MDGSLTGRLDRRNALVGWFRPDRWEGDDIENRCTRAFDFVNNKMYIYIYILEREREASRYRGEAETFNWRWNTHPLPRTVIYYLIF